MGGLSLPKPQRQANLTERGENEGWTVNREAFTTALDHDVEHLGTKKASMKKKMRVG